MRRLALRRLALRTTRNPSWLPVLQDALHETYGELFERTVEQARRYAAGWVGGKNWVVIVYHYNHAASERPFAIYNFNDEDLDWTLSGGWVRDLARRGRVVVFSTPRTG